MELNHILRTYAVYHNKLDRKEVFEEAFEEISRRKFRDLVFICEDEQVSYHSEIVSSISSVIRNLVEKSKSCECLSFMNSDLEFYVSLEGVGLDTVDILMSCLYGKQSMVFPKSDFAKVSALFKMLGIDGKDFTLEDPNLSKQDFETKKETSYLFKRKLDNEYEIGVKKLKTNENDHFEKKSEINDNNSVTMIKVEPTKQNISTELSSSQLPLPSTNLPYPPVSNSHTENKIQMFLPHLTVTSVKQDNAATKAEESSLATVGMERQESKHVFDGMIAADEVEENYPIEQEVYGAYDNDLKCPLAFCTSGKSFKVRSELLMHLACFHYTDQLLDLQPFIRGGVCQLCIDQHKPRPYSTAVKKPFVMHIGVTHELVLELLPQDLRNHLSSMVPKRRKSRSRFVQDTEMAPRNPSPRNYSDGDDRSYSNLYSRPFSRHAEEANDGYSQEYDESQRNFENGYPDNQAVAEYQSQTFHEDVFEKPTESSANVNSELYNSFTSSGRFDGVNEYEDKKETFNQFSDVRSQASDVKFRTNPNHFIEEQGVGGDIENKENAEETYDDHSEEKGGDNFLTSSQTGSSEPETIKYTEKLACHLCTTRSFPKKQDLLFHLTFSHLSKEVLNVHPYIENKECELCETNEPNVSTSKSSHLRHIGVAHSEVLKFVPSDVFEQLGIEPVCSAPSKDEVETVQEDANKEVPKVQEKDKEVKSEESNTSDLPVHKEILSVQCPLCTNKVRVYSKRSDFLKHLSLGHFGRNILQSNPYKDGLGCSICQESNKEFVPSKKEIHVCHLGVLHGKVFEYLTQQLLEIVKSLPTHKKVVVAKVETPVPISSVMKIDETTVTEVAATLHEEVA